MNQRKAGNVNKRKFLAFVPVFSFASKTSVIFSPVFSVSILKTFYEIKTFINIQTSVMQVLMDRNSVRMRENTDQNDSEYGHFLRSV